MSTFIDINENTLAITFNVVVLVFGFFFLQWYLFFTVNLHTYQHIFMEEYLPNIQPKRCPLRVQIFLPKMPRAKTWEQGKLSDFAYRVRNCCLK